MSDLPEIPTDAAPRPKLARSSDRPFRKPTGATPWPIMLLAGGPKAPTARLAAQASASETLDRLTLWLSWRERMPDALGAIPGARFEIVEHDGTLDDFEDALAAALTVLRERATRSGRPSLIVVDGIAQLGESIRDWAREAAPSSFWFAVNDRWSRLVAVLRAHPGPVLLVGRLDDDGDIVGHKDLANDVDVLAEVGPDGSAMVTATRTAVPIAERFDGFDVEQVWQKLGVTR